MVSISDTIVALSTAQGGAIGVIRLSGDKSITIADKILTSKTPLKDVARNTIVYGHIADKNGGIIDEVLLSLFKNPKSYTGEDVVEISCHGSSYIISTIISLLIHHGARLAEHGEFTQRAFLNGKMDLTQAEAIADLIASENRASHQIAIHQMRGGISNEMNELREQLIHFTSLIELELDFGEEDVQFADRNSLYALIYRIESKLQNLITSFEYGNAIKNGVPVAIVGSPNVGKSSLLNALVQEDRAIVSDIAGTTRDTIEESIQIDGIRFRFIDTAGIRETSEIIEQKGIEKSIQKIQESKIILYLVDRSTDTVDRISQFLATIPSEKDIILCSTKLDLYPSDTSADWLSSLQDKVCSTLAISCVHGADSLNNLKSTMISCIKVEDESHVILTNIRHLDAVRKAYDNIQCVKNGMEMNLSGDLLSSHLRDVLKNISEITGEIDIDKDILGAIFSKFCIGK